MYDRSSRFDRREGCSRTFFSIDTAMANRGYFCVVSERQELILASFNPCSPSLIFHDILLYPSRDS